MDAVNFTAAARIRVLLVPVGPIKRATFERHVRLLRQHTSVRLEEVWMGPRSENSFFSQNAPPEGQLYFHFSTTYNPEYHYLEEFQMHRRVFGVIGIMDCQEWSDGNIAGGHQQFQQIVAKYPTAVANQCFAFDPSEQQPDDLRGGGVIMIPNVGNTSSYLRVLICDLARTVLTEFENIAGVIGKRQDIESPSPANTVNPRYGASPSTPNPSSLPDMSANGIKPLTAPPSAMTTSGSSNHSRTVSAALPPTAPSGQYVQSTVVTDQKQRRRTAARAQKLYGDLYLMAGRLSDAVSSYQAVIEATKSNSDFLWHASAMEGLYCAVVLLAYVQADLSPIQQQQAQQTISAPMSPTTSEPTRTQSAPAIKPLIIDIPEKYQSILTLYTRVPSNGTPPILFVEACIKVAKFLATCFVCGNGILDDRALAAVVSGNMFMHLDGSEGQQPPQVMSYSSSGNHSQTSSSGASGLLQRASTLRSRSGSVTVSSNGVTRTDIMTWIGKTWIGRLDELWVVDQIHFTTTIASILGSIQFRRKQSLYLRHAVRMVLPLLHQTRLAQAAAVQASGKASKKTSDHGVLDIMTQICNVFGVGDNFTSSTSYYLDHGWPELQIDVLYEGIRVAEAIPDYKAMMNFSTTLLRQLHAFLSKEDQAGLYASLPRILAAAKKTNVPDLTEIHYWSKTLIEDIEICPPSARKTPFTRSKDTLKAIIPETKLPAKAGGETDPFIYNPFHRKANNKSRLELVAGETAYFIVTLTNPHSIDLEVQEIRLSTSGVEFEAIPTSTMIPAQTTVTIKVAGVPKQDGELVIRGCMVQILHCVEQEFFVINPRTGLPMDTVIKNVTAPTGEAMARFKKRGMESFTLQKSKDDTDPKFNTVPVIPPQPLMKISSTSLQQGSVMLFEGEKTTIRLVLENIGSTPVDFVTLTFSDSTSQLVIGNNYSSVVNSNGVELSAEDAYETELFLKKLHVFSWNRDVECHIPVGATRELKVEVLGKRGCSTGMIQIDYAYLNRKKADGGDVTIKETGGEAQQEEESSTFVTRQLFLQVLMTVYKTVECLNLDVLYLQSHGGMDIPATEPSSPVLDSLSEDIGNQDPNLPRIDFSNDGFLAPPESGGDDGDEEGGDTGKADDDTKLSAQQNAKTIQIQEHKNSRPKSYGAGRRGSRTISKRLSSNFAKVEQRQSVEQLLSMVRGDAVLPGEQIEAAISRRVALGTKNEYCLLTLDVRNVWTVPVEVSVLVDDSEDGEGLDTTKLIKSTTVIQPGNTQRIILPIRRMVLSTEQLSAPIPKLSNKQFVVSRGVAGALTAEEQALERGLFWFREELLKRVVARWTCKDASGRFGKFNLRTLRLTKPMLNVLKIEDISFLVTMESTAAMKQAEQEDTSDQSKRRLEQIGSNRWRCPVDQFAQIRFTVVNRSHMDVKLCLRMQPVQVHGDGTMEYNLGSRMAWHGVLQAPLAKMQPDSTTSHVLPVCFYSRGEFKMLYHAEDVHRRVVYYDHEPLVIEAF
ncbi:TRAPP II complex [Mortierella sp. GBAus27b]|nr:TRAPP II complex [Mortierella sp. GBAus27b]